MSCLPFFVLHTTIHHISFTTCTSVYKLSLPEETAPFAPRWPSLATNSDKIAIEPQQKVSTEPSTTPHNAQTHFSRLVFSLHRCDHGPSLDEVANNRLETRISEVFLFTLPPAARSSVLFGSRIKCMRRRAFPARQTRR
ncbi:uncharacterized protein H6S33_012322 [Morchella sextelata]|uniref:uncharacterized protein n=1 Tax=Morchella sextelata TaxID=1174677 RepID=UPI001D04050E|nr:uncharacterized protein H6S33_012322 [Morchella sextelata]KAH0609776.1 hypothetical protein H6S33_012322 [Morchella sextelata]